MDSQLVDRILEGDEGFVFREESPGDPEPLDPGGEFEAIPFVPPGPLLAESTKSPLECLEPAWDRSHPLPSTPREERGDQPADLFGHVGDSLRPSLRGHALQVGEQSIAQLQGALDRVDHPFAARSQLRESSLEASAQRRCISNRPGPLPTSHEDRIDHEEFELRPERPRLAEGRVGDLEGTPYDFESERMYVFARKS